MESKYSMDFRNYVDIFKLLLADNRFVDDLYPEEEEDSHNEVASVRCSAAYDRLDLIMKLCLVISRYRPLPF